MSEDTMYRLVLLARAKAKKKEKLEARNPQGTNNTPSTFPTLHRTKTEMTMDIESNSRGDMIIENKVAKRLQGAYKDNKVPPLHVRSYSVPKFQDLPLPHSKQVATPNEMGDQPIQQSGSTVFNNEHDHFITEMSTQHEQNSVSAEEGDFGQRDKGYNRFTVGTFEREERKRKKEAKGGFYILSQGHVTKAILTTKRRVSSSVSTTSTSRSYSVSSADGNTDNNNENDMIIIAGTKREMSPPKLDCVSETSSVASEGSWERAIVSHYQDVIRQKNGGEHYLNSTQPLPLDENNETEFYEAKDVVAMDHGQQDKDQSNLNQGHDDQDDQDNQEDNQDDQDDNNVHQKFINETHSTNGSLRHHLSTRALQPTTSDDMAGENAALIDNVDDNNLRLPVTPNEASVGSKFD
ncbi:hypothetical protein RFI_07547 [Reticulomyxa filosa]|uniref:Uncharacterized protein n=1 Tax=Reticulomyxa filosa TaxID=46433 RepID=X6NUV0_RETFI|nr:hypothetical protein RFI_07547 [Reticulomyxa filosa]|eukprot:ETO29574.1 hypothetical protein RFI_07547 [Reticulomyxa filosa]